MPDRIDAEPAAPGEPELPLLATCWATAGDAVPLPGRHRSPVPMRTRIEAAARAGFVGFGILDHDLHPFLLDHSLADLRSMLDDHGLAYVELEFLTRWWTSGPERAESDRARAFLLTAAEVLGAHHIKVAPDLDDTSPPDIGMWAEQFHALSVDAARHGTAVALEFMPFANVATLDLALEIAEAADHEAGGLVIDEWHIERSGLDPVSLETVPIERVLAVEIDDGRQEAVGDPYDDTVLRRLIPGQGEFRTVDFAAALMRAGWRQPWGTEILSEEYRRRPVDEALEELVKGTREQLHLAWRDSNGAPIVK